MLWEITDIPGIFSILNIAKFDDNKDKDEEKEDLKKYVQVPIFISKEIELTEKAITEDIKKQYNEMIRVKYRLLQNPKNHDYNFSFFNFGGNFINDEKINKNYTFPPIIIKRPFSNYIVHFFYADLFQLNLSFEEYMKKIIIDYYRKIPLIDLIFEEHLMTYSLKEVTEKISSFLKNTMNLLLPLDSPSENAVISEKDYQVIAEIIPREYFSKNGNVYISKSHLIQENKVLFPIMEHIVYCNVLYLFIDDLSRSFKNYREFKENLRIAQSKKISYFEYKIEEWKYSELSKITDLLENEFSILMNKYGFKSNDFSIEYLFVNILYNTYLWREEEYRNSLQEKNDNE